MAITNDKLIIRINTAFSINKAMSIESNNEYILYLF